jgi:hypothetical protein
MIFARIFIPTVSFIGGRVIPHTRANLFIDSPAGETPLIILIRL